MYLQLMAEDAGHLITKGKSSSASLKTQSVHIRCSRLTLLARTYLPVTMFNLLDASLNCDKATLYFGSKSLRYCSCSKQVLK